MADKPGSQKPSDLMPFFVLLLFVILIFVGINPLICVKKVGGDDNLGGGCVQPEPKIVTNDIDTTAFEYTVVVECYESKKDAYSAAGRLRASQINNFVMEHKGAWQVCVGKYFSRKRAERQIAVLKTHGVADPVLFPPGKSKCVPTETTFIFDYTAYVLLAIVIIIFIVIATQNKKPPQPQPQPQPPKVETTITITTATKPDVKEAKKDG